MRKGIIEFVPLIMENIESGSEEYLMPNQVNATDV